jgi:predicted alpha/beta superfamily hydrolase
VVNKAFLIGLILALAGSLSAQLPQPTYGTVKRFADFPSKYVQPRNVDVWLPEDYSPAKKYAVIYMHDGQMLFDSSFSWNHQEWNAEVTLTQLMREQRIRDCLVVGVWNNGKYRHAEYFPEKVLQMLPEDLRKEIIHKDFYDTPMADNYLRFLVRELKPFIDSAFSTRKDRANTFIMGSSMGGLISMYAVCEYPDVFGDAGCLSTHWPGSLVIYTDTIPAAFNRYLADHIPSPRTHKFYFDYGSVSLDKLYKPYQDRIDITMKKAGYTEKNWMTRSWPGEDHSEHAWSRRLSVPVLFLVGKK